ncbi:MAG: response regulator [Tannerellaceae bacterium]|jgi:signal transduction histidine kinase/CheY-like chemotaxis protein|nr:response regulator [Tannerellaceae bacterium]
MNTEKLHRKRKSGHAGPKVIAGYVALILIAVFALSHIYAIVREIAVEEDINSVPRQKIYLVTTTRALLHESEAIGQLLNMEEEDFSHFNETLDRAHANMDSLRQLVVGTPMSAQIDTIDILIERKRMNTNALLQIWKDANKDLYAANMEKALATLLPPIEEEEVTENVVSESDTVVVATERRGFMARLREVFVPTAADSSLIVSQNEKMMRDARLKIIDANATISKTLNDIRNNVAMEKERLRELLAERSTALRYDNSMISSRINQILRTIEEEELNASLARMEKRQGVLGETAYLITGIALLSVFVALFFLILIGRDLFRSRYYRKQLEQVVDSREKLILTISHDVRAPLSSIIGYTELMQRYRYTEQQNTYLRNIAGSSKHILSLVNDLLDYQRLESGRMDTHEVPLRIPELFREIADSFLPQAKAKGLDFELLVENATDKVYMADSVRIRQIVGNLINNAIKFTAEGSVKLIVDCSRLSLPQKKGKPGDSGLIVTVRDTGAGIDESQRKKIFADFARLPGAEKAEGFGLGLSITNRLVRLLGGKIDLYSQPGKGSDFVVILPVKEADRTVEIPDDAVEIISFEEEAITCLMVDDDLLQIALVEEVLKRSNIRVISCTNPYSVIEMLKNNRIDILLSDVQMPGMDGFELIKQIRMSPVAEIKAMPVIALSGSVGNNDAIFKDSGFTDWLMKPFTGGRLISLIASLLPDNKQLKSEHAGIAPNFSGLTEFAGNDEDASAAILKTFFIETTKHTDLLKEALPAADRGKAAVVAHKLIPLFTTLGTKTLVQQLKILEQNPPELTDSGWERLMTDVIGQVSSVMEME